MASSSSLAHFNSADARDKGLETIEIDPQYAQGLGFAEGDIVSLLLFGRAHTLYCLLQVEIGLLYDLPYASSVGTEPVTSDDWEIVVSMAVPSYLEPRLSYSAQEIHASHVESTLISQVRVAKIGQEIDFWVLGRTRVRLTVGTLENSFSIVHFPS
jgi:peroxin-1